MRNETIHTLAVAVSDQNKVIDFKTNSVFNAIDSMSNEDELGDLSKLIANKVGNEVGLIRNKFLPLLKQYRDIINRMFTERGSFTKLGAFKLDVVNYPELFNMLGEKGLLPSTPNNGTITGNYGNIQAPANVRAEELFKTGVATIDNAMSEIIAKYSDEELASLWDRVFGYLNRENAAIANLAYVDVKGMERLALIYVATKRLKDNGGDLSPTLRTGITDLDSTLKEFIALAAKRIKDYNSKGILILGTKNKTISVYGPSFRTYTKSNSIEALLGAATKEYIEPDERTLDNFTTVSERYLAIWEREVRMDKIATQSENRTMHMLVFELALAELYKDGEASALEYSNMTADQARQMLLDYLAGFDAGSILDTESITKYIIGDIVLADTNTTIFLDSMVKYRKLDNTISAKEAASLATLDMITSYALAQVVVKG